MSLNPLGADTHACSKFTLSGIFIFSQKNAKQHYFAYSDEREHNIRTYKDEIITQGQTQDVYNIWTLLKTHNQDLDFPPTAFC